MGEPERKALFISHAAPEDNAFTLWLGAKLTALGYEVFADILKLRGGDDWERILEHAIREKAGRFLLVATPHGVQKQGVRNEITIAVKTSKKLKDDNFIVPLRLAEFEPPLQIAHAQYIDFSKGWSAGLSELLALLEELQLKPNTADANPDAWRGVQLKDARTVIASPERLISNWLSIESLPPQIFFYDFKAGISIGKAQHAIQASQVPLAPHNRGFISFAPIDQLQDYFGPNLPLQLMLAIDTDSFLDSGIPEPHMAARDARAKFTDMLRQAMDGFFLSKDLRSFEVASGRLAWWPTAPKATLKKLPFRWADGPNGLRQIVGRSNKRGFHWHYGVSCWARTVPVRHIRIAGRVIFTSDGNEPLGDAKRLHRYRRSFCKGWRNDKWRDLLLAFWFWLAEGAEYIDVSLGEGATMRLKLPPLGFNAAFGLDTPADRDEETERDEEGDDLVGDDSNPDDPEEFEEDE